MGTTWEQMEGAALALVRAGPIKDRLAEAFRNHLALVNAEELPEAIRSEFRACNEALTREHPLRGEDAVRATVRKMSNHEADEIACTVVRLFAALVRETTLQAAAAQVAAAAAAHVAATVAAQAAAVVNGAPAPAPARGKASVARSKSAKSVPQVISLYGAAESLS